MVLGGICVCGMAGCPRPAAHWKMRNITRRWPLHRGEQEHVFVRKRGGEEKGSLAGDALGTSRAILPVRCQWLRWDHSATFLARPTREGRIEGRSLSLGDAVPPNRTKPITSPALEIPAPLHSALLSTYSTPLFADIITRPNAREGGKNKDIRRLAGGLAPSTGGHTF